jgi:Ca2+-binding RTX toxin-like protein
MTTPVTPEFAIAVSSGSNTPEPRLTTLADGRLLVTWYDIGSNGGDIRHRIYDVDGTALTAELTTVASTAGNQTAQSVAALSGGGFVVVWQDFAGDAMGNVRYRVFDATGNAVASDLATTDEQSGNRQADPTVIGNADGGFVILWTDRNGTNSNRPEGTDAVVGRTFSATGGALDGIVRITGTTGTGIAAEIDSDSSGIYGIWDDNALDGIYAGGGEGLPDVDQTGVDVEFGAGTTSEASRTPDIAATAAGVVAVWEQSGVVYYQIADQVTATLGPVLQLTTSTFEQGSVRVDALPFGGFVATWEEFRNPSGNFTSFDIFARVFDASGNPVGDPVNLTQGQTGAEFDPDVTALIDGRFMVGWSSQGTLGDVIGRIYDARTAPVNWDGGFLGERFVGTDIAGPGDDLNGRGGNDSIQGQAGDDTLDGGDGDDTLVGGEGNDTISGGDGRDSLYGGSGDDVLVVDRRFLDDIFGGPAGGTGDLADIGLIKRGLNVDLAAGTYRDGATVYAMEDIERVVLGSGRDTVTGSVGADFIDAGGKRDQLNGGLGNDTIYAGDGDDVVIGGLGGDLTFGGSGVDTIDFGAVTSGISFDMDTGVTNGFGTHTLYENVVGGSGNDTIMGSDRSEIIRGEGGNDQLFGGRGNDQLVGLNGSDTLSGGAGNDTLTGGGFADVFVFARVASAGSDVVLDFGKGADRLQLDDALWTGALTAQQVVDGFASVVGSDVVFDFGNRGAFTLAGITTLTGLAATIDII